MVIASTTSSNPSLYLAVKSIVSMSGALKMTSPTLIEGRNFVSGESQLVQRLTNDKATGTVAENMNVLDISFF